MSVRAALAPSVVASGALAAGAPLVLVDPAAPLAETWQHRVFGRATEYHRVEVDGRAAIQALGRDSASGLYRRVAGRVAERPWLESAWRVEHLQPSADIRVKAREDFAAAIFLLFEGPPGRCSGAAPWC